MGKDTLYIVTSLILLLIPVVFRAAVVSERRRIEKQARHALHLSDGIQLAIFGYPSLVKS